MRDTTIAEENAERDILARWEKDVELRAEFGDSRAACVAFFKAAARGQVKILGGSVVAVKGQRASATPMDSDE